MEFLAILHTYFAGERAEGLFFIAPLGLLCLVFAAVMLRTQEGAFMWGTVIPFALLGLALLVVGATVGLRTPAQVAELTTLYQRDAAALVAQEVPRMAAVNRMWPIYLATWCTFAVAGMALRFGLSSDWARGLGPALVFFGGVGLLIDSFAERRAHPYTAALEQLQRASAQG